MAYPTPPFTFNSEEHELFTVAVNDFNSPEDVATMIRYTDWSRFRTFQASDVAAIIRRGQVMPANAINPQRAKRHLERLQDAYLAAEEDERNFADHNILTRKACNYILCGYLRTNATTAEIADVVNAQSLMPVPLDKLDAHMVEKIYDYLAANCPEKMEEWKLMDTQDPEGRRIVEKYKALLDRGADHQVEFLLVPREYR
ncbi:MAG: hypothetical protein L6R38_005947 [Xanthoria sp. 2 TBL-2021]|nr:MAG: hypothetical protein L6R38_005947 [Xanthoria sp. 2 TBL-2021]